jgi:hypothetical protein
MKHPISDSTDGFAQSGTTGNLAWTLSDGVLTISGAGAIPDYDDNYSLWQGKRIIRNSSNERKNSPDDYLLKILRN